MDEKARSIIDGALDRRILSAIEIRRLLTLPVNSEEYFYIRYAALEINKRVMEGKAEIHGQVGINSGPCACNCAFCSFAASNRVFNEHKLEPIESVVEKSLQLEAGGVNAVYLMTTAGFKFTDFLDISRSVRNSLQTDTILVANIGDFGYPEAMALKEAGFNGVYHAVRLGEGVVTRISVQKRLDTIAAVHKAGLKLGTCVEPVGPEHSLDELVDKIIITREAKPVFSGAMRRVPIPGTSLAQYGKTSEDRMAHILAVVRLAVGHEVMGNCTHEPNVLGVSASANLLWAEAGANPRDIVHNTESNRGFGIPQCREIIEEAGFEWMPGPSRMFV